MKTKLTITSLVFIGLTSCVSLKEHNKVKNDLQGQIDTKQDNLNSLSQELDKTRSKLGQLGELSTTKNTSETDEKKANSYKGDGSWVTLKNPEVYKNYLTGGLGIIWLEKTDGSLIEGGFVDFGKESVEPEIIDQGNIIFKYFVSNKFKSNLSVLSAVTANINDEDFARLRYEILGTSRLKISQTSIENIAKTYANRYSAEIKAVYLTTGFHVRKISLTTYTKMATNAVATVPVASVNGEFYNESESEINNWYVEARLIDLKLFVPNKELEDKKVLAKNETPYQLLKRIFGDKIPDEVLLKIAENPALMTEENIKKLNEQIGNKALSNSELFKLDAVGETLEKSQTDLFKSDF